MVVCSMSVKSFLQSREHTQGLRNLMHSELNEPVKEKATAGQSALQSDQSKSSRAGDIQWRLPHYSHLVVSPGQRRSRTQCV